MPKGDQLLREIGIWTDSRSTACPWPHRSLISCRNIFYCQSCTKSGSQKKQFIALTPSSIWSTGNEISQTLGHRQVLSAVRVQMNLLYHCQNNASIEFSLFVSKSTKQKVFHGEPRRLLYWRESFIGRNTDGRNVSCLNLRSFYPNEYQLCGVGINVESYGNDAEASNSQ